MITTREFTVGDRLTSLLANLYQADEVTPIVLGDLETVVFRMVNKNTGVVKVNNAAAVVVSKGNSTVPAQVRYDWSSGDVDTAGTFAAWFIRHSGGETEHFPTQIYNNPEFRVIFRSDSAS